MRRWQMVVVSPKEGTLSESPGIVRETGSSQSSRSSLTTTMTEVGDADDGERVTRAKGGRPTLGRALRWRAQKRVRTGGLQLKRMNCSAPDRTLI